MGMLNSNRSGGRRPYFGLTGGWLTFWVSVACSTDMTLFGYDQGVFGTFNDSPDFARITNLNAQ